MVTQRVLLEGGGSVTITAIRITPAIRKYIK
jgi:hypothetical protein